VQDTQDASQVDTAEFGCFIMSYVKSVICQLCTVSDPGLQHYCLNCRIFVCFYEPK